jgi:hypothetical protein
VLKWFLAVVIFATIIGGSIAAVFVYQSNNQQALNTPLVNFFKPDFKSNLKNKIIVSPKLIGDVTKKFDKVPKDIRYLAYNLDAEKYTLQGHFRTYSSRIIHQTCYQHGLSTY